MGHVYPFSQVYGTYDSRKKNNDETQVNYQPRIMMTSMNEGTDSGTFLYLIRISSPSRIQYHQYLIRILPSVSISGDISIPISISISISISINDNGNITISYSI